MGYQALIDALRQEADKKVGLIRQEAEAEAERIRSEAAERLARLRETYAKRGAEAEATEPRGIVAEGENRARLVKLTAEEALADRLYAIARRSLTLLRSGDYPGLFGSLARELPAVEWEKVRVNPEDEYLAVKHFPVAETAADSAVSGGMEVTRAGGRFRIDNTLEKRLDRGWPEILPDLVRDVYLGG